MQNKPVFVKIDEYNEISKTVKNIKGKIEQAKTILKRISELKIEEYNQLSKWGSSLGEVEKKIDAVDKALGKPEQV